MLGTQSKGVMLGTAFKERNAGNSHKREGCWEHPSDRGLLRATIKERDAGSPHERKGCRNTCSRRDAEWEPSE